MALPWLPVSLDPAATWRGLLALIPAVSIFLAMLSLERQQRRVVILLSVVFAVASLPLDLLQMMGDTDSPLRFYAITNPDRAVGLFANANHHAAFLYCALPFAVSWAIGFMSNHDHGRAIGMPALLAAVIAVIIALALTHSRAGLALGFIAGLCCLALIWRDRHTRSRRKLVLYGLGANFIGLLVAFQFGFVALANKIENADTIEIIRWPVATVTSQAALANMPFGSGFGTFVPVYEMHAPRTMLRGYYVNHAHDDWLELWLTGGVPALVIALAFLTWFLWSSMQVWRRHPPDAIRDPAFARAASIVIALLLLHSIVDYPLRSAAIEVLFAAACTLLIPAARGGRDDDSLPAA
jgi:O-antigen ligase